MQFFIFVVYYLKSTDHSESKVFSIFSQTQYLRVREGDVSSRVCPCGEVPHVIGPVQTCSLGDTLLWTYSNCSL